MHRRKFIRNTAMTVTALTVFQQVFGKGFFDEPWKIKMLRGDIGVFTEKGGTIGFYISKKGIVVVDAQFPEQSQHLIDELKKRSSRAFHLLINTHHHGDHSSGNISFKGLVDHVVAHKNSLANQLRVAESQKTTDKQLFPDQTFDSSWKARAGKERIKAYYFGPAHTNGDAMIHFEKANVVHMGDLVFNRRFPFIDRTAGANIKNWIEVLEKALSQFNDETIFIFGHALDPEKITGDKNDIRAFQNYLVKLLEFVRRSIQSGKTKEEVLKATNIPGAEEWSGQGIERSLTAAWEELQGQ